MSEEDAHFLLSQIAKRHEETVGRRYPLLFFFLFLLSEKEAPMMNLKRERKNSGPPFPEGRRVQKDGKKS